MIVDLNQARDQRIERAWTEYVEASSKAQSTLDMEDGKAAAQAWQRWLRLFMAADERAYLDGRPATVSQVHDRRQAR